MIHAKMLPKVIADRRPAETLCGVALAQKTDSWGNRIAKDGGPVSEWDTYVTCAACRDMIDRMAGGSVTTYWSPNRSVGGAR